MKLFAIAAAAILVTPIPFARAGATSPLSTVQALMDAEQAFDLDRALSLFAEDAVIVNAAGATTAGAEKLKRFLTEDMWFNDSFKLEQPAVDHNQVSWTESVSEDFYRKLGVAPVHFAFTATVDQGKIELIVAHVPLEEIARIEAACGHITKPMIDGRPCSEYIRYLRHQADAVY
jgi:limonene-1,2-epoxide hydrolase